VNSPEIVATISSCLATVLRQDLPVLAEDTRLFDDLQLDSTTILELLMALEDAMGVEVDPESLDMGSFRTVGTLTDYLRQMINVPA
jgi:acyl carrier protein